MKRRIYVKPVTGNSELFGWVTLKLTIPESFIDDWKRYGARAAIINLIHMLRRAARSSRRRW